MAKYPWSQCVSDQKGKGSSEESANKICGSIKAKNAQLLTAKSADSNCVSHFVNDGKKQDQAVAICINSPKAHTAQRLGQIVNKMNLLTAQLNLQNFTNSLTQSKQDRFKFASLDENFSFPEEESKYHAYFLIKGSELNGNGWNIPNEKLPEIVQTFVDKPFIITADEFIENSPYKNRYMHPRIEHFEKFMPELIQGLSGEKVEDVLKFQDIWKVGDIKKVLYDSTDDYWKALVKPLPQFEDKKFPPFASPGFMKGDTFENDNNITSGTGVHLSGLMDRPAYGSQAIYEGTCNGTLGHCTTQFSNPKDIFDTELKLSKSKIASMLSTDNPNVNVVPVCNDKKENCLKK